MGNDFETLINLKLLTKEIMRKYLLRETTEIWRLPFFSGFVDGIGSLLFMNYPFSEQGS